MATQDPSQQIIQIHHPSSSSHSTSVHSNQYFPMSYLKNLIRSPSFISILLTLTTFIISAIIHTAATLSKCLAFLLIACVACSCSHLLASVLVYFIERCFAIKYKKTLYFVFALNTSVEYLFSSSFILLSSWVLMIKSDTTVFVTSTLVTCVFAAAVWTLMIVILKVLDCGFHDKHFFDNMQDLISHEYVLQTLLGPPRRLYDNSNNNVMRGTYLKWIKYGIGSVLYHVCARSHTICGALNKANIVDDENQVDDAISMVFKNLTNNEQRDLEETDLLRVMKEEEIANVLQLFEGAAETKRITESSLRNWMVQVCNRRKVVAHLLNSSSKVIEQLNKIFLVTLSFLVALLWCLMMGFETTKYSVFISSLLVVLGWFSGKFCIIICDGITLAIVMHPFDKGDHCIIDNEQLAVEEIGLINTVFLKNDNERLNYPNSVLLTKPITNLNRSSDVGIL